jgi:malate dehydrogenase
MERVAIIGAGELGGAIAHTIARRNLARSITLIDDTGDMAAGKALDIAEGAPVEGFSTELRGDRDISAAIGAEAIFIADRASVVPSERVVPDGMLLLKQVSSIRAGAVVICAGAVQSELIGRGVGELRLPRSGLFGSAPEALASGARALVALAVNGSPRDVVLSVLGVPPSHTMIAWEEATVAGFPLTRLLDEPSRRRLVVRVRAIWPPGPQALASAAASALAALQGRSRRILSCFVAPDFSAGMRTRTAALPVRLGPGGIAEVLQPSLSVVERVALDNAMLL